MAVFRINKTDGFVVMSNSHFRDDNLSLKAKGLLSEMLSLPENWDYTIQGLAAINKENESAIKSALNELKDAGYLVVTKLMPNETQSGRIEYIYDIYEQAGEKQGLENQGVVFQGVENQGQYNIYNKINNNKIYNNTDHVYEDKNGVMFKTSETIPPTLRDVQDYCRERNNGIDAERFIDYYEARDWKIKGVKMKSWKAAVRTWERYDKNDKPKETASYDLGAWTGLEISRGKQ